MISEEVITKKLEGLKKYRTSKTPFYYLTLGATGELIDPSGTRKYIYKALGTLKREMVDYLSYGGILLKASEVQDLFDKLVADGTLVIKTL